VQRAGRLLWQAAKKHGMSVMTGIIMLLLVAWVSLLPPLTMKAIVDNGIAGRDDSLLARLTLRLVGLYLTTAILDLAANGRMGGFAGRAGSIEQAVRRNRVLERLRSRLPEGLATKVGEGGRNLSGGQRQTVAIARAFLRCARIVVFDEATAHLDSEAHAVVEEAVQELFSDRLCIVLTHDPSLARIARQRVRMDQGMAVDID